MADVYGSMLTSNGSQYLHPDYLQPLPTTLDAKKSPLALLAQTCSSIGKDSNVPPSKSIIPPIEKKDNVGKSSLSKKTDAESKSAGNVEKNESDSESGGDKRDRRPRSPKSARESCKSTESCEDHVHEEKVRVHSTSPIHSPGASPSREKVTDKSSHLHTEASCSSRASAELGHYESITSKPMSKSPMLSTSSSSSSNVSSSKPGSAGHPLQPSISFGSSLPPGYPLLSAHGLQMDPSLASAYSSYGAHMNGLGLASPLAAASALKSTFSPYVSYSRIRTSNGSTLIPVCRDPYCANCQMSLQNSHLSATCTAAGCSQCAHEKSLLASMYSPSVLAQTLPHSFSGLNGYASSSLANSALLGASLYPYGLLSSSPAHAIPPFVCNWVSGSDYCGKRFNASEELLHHLRTHTSASDSASLAAHYQLGLVPPSASALAALHAHYMTPGSLSPNSAARRSYPLSLSPVSSALTSSRFHPYKTTMPPIPTAPPIASHPTLAPYYSPYSLYAQRIGAAAP